MSEVKMSITARIVLAIGTFLMLLLIAGQVHWADRASAQTVPEAPIGPALAAPATSTPTPVPAEAPAGMTPVLLVCACGLVLAILALLLILWRRKKKRDEYE